MMNIKKIASDYAFTVRLIVSHPLAAGNRLGAMGRYLGWNIGRRLINAGYLVKLAGDAELVVTAGENYGTLAYAQGVWDFGDMMLLLHMLRPGDLFADIGSNVGAYSIMAGKVAGADVIAFEPAPDTFSKLQRNIRLNALEGKVDGRNMGLGDKSGVVRFTNDQGGMNHIVPQGADGMDIIIETLDTVLAGRIPAAMKIDVEGYEVPVLHGAKRTLSDERLQVIVAEINGSGGRYGYSDADLHNVICGHGFAPCTYDPFTRVLTRCADYNRNDLNTIYTRIDMTELQSIVEKANKIEVRGKLV